MVVEALRGLFECQVEGFVRQSFSLAFRIQMSDELIIMSLHVAHLQYTFKPSIITSRADTKSVTIRRLLYKNLLKKLIPVKSKIN